MVSKFVRNRITVSFTVLVAGCGPGDDVEGTRVPTWQLVEDFKLGSVEGDVPEGFGASVVLEATKEGVLYVGDPQSAEIRYFDAEGRYLRSLGGRGNGPGEFRDLIGLALDPAGRLWAADRGAGRISIFDPEGQLVETQPHSGFSNLGWGGRIDSSGILHNPVLLSVTTGFQPGYERWTQDRRDTVAVPVYTAVQREIRAADGRTRLINVPFSPRPHWTIDTDGLLWFAVSDAYVLYRIGYDGDTLRIVERPAERIALSPSERERAVSLMQGSFGDEAYIDPQWVPTERPVFESLHVDDQGRLWVAIPTPEGRQSFEVLDLDGRLVARAELPRDISLASRPLVRGSFMYLVTRDDLDITYVVRLHIEETPAT